MSRTERREYLVGVMAATALIAIMVLTALANRRAIGHEAGLLSFTAEFTRADGIYLGAPVRVAGVTVGSVTKTVLNANRRAQVTLTLTQSVPLPEDTAAVIETDGVFGPKHIELRPGGEEKVLAPGARIAYTQDSVIIEDLIARIVSEAQAAHSAPESANGASSP